MHCGRASHCALWTAEMRVECPCSCHQPWCLVMPSQYWCLSFSVTLVSWRSAQTTLVYLEMKVGPPYFPCKVSVSVEYDCFSLLQFRKTNIGMNWFRMLRSVGPLLRPVTHTIDMMQWRFWNWSLCCRGVWLILQPLPQRHPDLRVACPATS